LRAGATADERRHRADAGDELRAIIPGRVVAVSVSAGDRVVVGQPLLVVEAMKMQNELRSPRDGIVVQLAVGPGQTIELGDLLAVIAEATDAP
jgi:biotin carboxyl carrier protein